MSDCISIETYHQALHLPRILCLHGGGTNARIFHAQCRVIRAALKSKFRLCFAEAPFPSQPGPNIVSAITIETLAKTILFDVVSVYRDFGPFCRWLRSESEHPKIDPKMAVDLIQKSLAAAIREDDLRGGTGEWVGILGFSQGAKMAASLLLQQQLRAARLGDKAVTNYRFGVLFAGRGPLVSMDPELLMNMALVDASEIGISSVPLEQCDGSQEHILRIPTLHVHGIRDPGLASHRLLLGHYFQKGSARLLEWDGDHRMPIKTKDVAVIVEKIIDIAKETGVLWADE